MDYQCEPRSWLGDGGAWALWRARADQPKAGVLDRGGSMNRPAGTTPEERLPCGCYATVDKDGYRWIAAEAFLCEARHKQGDLVEVREGLARLPGESRDA